MGNKIKVARKYAVIVKAEIYRYLNLIITQCECILT